MNRFHLTSTFFLSVVLCGTLAGAKSPGTQAPKPQVPVQRQLPHVDDIGFCKPYTWLSGGWVGAPRMPLLGDVNGDGYADLIDASPSEKIVDISLNGKGWKPMRGNRLISGLPEEIRSMCFAHLGGQTL